MALMLTASERAILKAPGVYTTAAVRISKGTEEPKAAPKRIQKMNILSDDNVDVDITPKVGRNNVIVNLCSCSVTFSSLL